MHMFVSFHIYFSASQHTCMQIHVHIYVSISAFCIGFVVDIFSYIHLYLHTLTTKL